MKNNGFSLIEILIVISIMVILIGITIPSINALQKSFNSTGGENIISSALNTARTIAMTNGHYAGIRFQKEYSPNPFKSSQYIIFILYNEDTNNFIYDDFYIAEAYKPIKLPTNVGVMNMNKIIQDSDIANDACFIDATTFSIVFSSAGKMLVHNVQVYNKNNEDDIFNTPINIQNGRGVFVRDEIPKQSQTNFTIYDCEKFNKTNPIKRYTEYLKDLKPVFINIYTGDIIK